MLESSVFVMQAQRMCFFCIVSWVVSWLEKWSGKWHLSLDGWVGVYLKDERPRRLQTEPSLCHQKHEGTKKMAGSNHERCELWKECEVQDERHELSYSMRKGVIYYISTFICHKIGLGRVSWLLSGKVTWSNLCFSKMIRDDANEKLQGEKRKNIFMF